MEQGPFKTGAKDTETTDITASSLDEPEISCFSRDHRTRLNSYLKPALESSPEERFSKNVGARTRKRLMSQRPDKIVKRRSLSPDPPPSEATAAPSAESSSIVDQKIDAYESLTQKEGRMDVVEHLSPLPSMQADELNDSTICPNDLSNDSNMSSDMGINEPMYSDQEINSPQLYPDTGMTMTGSQLMADSQIFTNTCRSTLNIAPFTDSRTSALGPTDVSLNVAPSPELGGPSTNSSQGFDLLQNMHYDTNASQHMAVANTFAAAVGLDEAVSGELNRSLNQVNRYASPYLYQYGPNPQNAEPDEYMDFNEGMDYVENAEYMLNSEIDYVMDSNYTQDNTNLAINNDYDPNGVFSGLDNLTQSQDQLSNTHTVNGFNTAPEHAEELAMDDLGSCVENELMRNNSINVLIENADKKLDEGVMNSILRDLICPICLEYFYFPVTVACGHTFCRYCIGHSKLSGKMCPLCRQPIGRSLNINTILSNLVKSLKLRKRGHLALARPPDVSQLAEKVWWDEHCLKPFVSVPLFIRIMFGGMAQAPVFFDDLCSCLIDYFDSTKKWYKSKWVFTIEDFRLIRNLIGLQLNATEPGQPPDENAAAINDTNNMRLHHWVEDYLIANPHLCFRSDVMYPLTLKVYHDVNHKIEGTIFSALDIPYKLPWDAGRHVKSLLHLPHSSVSLSHLIFAQCPNGQFGILDVGSTIGTMIKIQGVHVLQSGDRIHIGDKHEVDVHIYKDSIGTPFKDFKWDSNTNQVINYAEYLNSQHAASQSEPGDQSSLEKPSQAEYAIDLDADGNLQELDSYLKLRIFADLQVERDVWICPKGVILGRGPATQSSYKKLSITTQNGYISREHCLIYYDGSRPAGSRWLLRDMSTLGTFLKLKPFQDPLPVSPGFVFKVGQCKVEVGSPHELSRRVPSSATLILSQLLQSHIEPFRLVEIPSNIPNPTNNTAGGNYGANFPIHSSVGGASGNLGEASRFQGAPAAGFDPSPELGGDVDPDGQVVPDSLRDAVL